MSRISDRIDKVIDAELTPLLTESGFVKDRRFFRKMVEGRTQVINVRSHSYANHGDTGRFMVDAGVFDPEFHDFWSGEKLEGKLKIDACSLCLQLEYKSPGSRQGDWWLLDENSDDAAVAAELAEAVRVGGLPWLEMCCDPSQARDYLESQAQILLSGGWPFGAKALLIFEIVYFGKDKARATLHRLIKPGFRDWLFRHLNLNGWLFGCSDKEIRDYLIETGRELDLH